MTDPNSRIEAALAQLGSEHEPPAGWEGRVLARVERRPWWRHLLRWQIVAPIAAAAAIAIALVIPRHRDLAVDITYAQGSEVVRGASPHVGQVMRAAATGGERHRALWIYRDDALVIACPGAPGCGGSDGAVTAGLALATEGYYVIIALASQAPIDAPGGVLDTDVRTAQNAGADVKRTSVRVR